jgi:hypothetical protein
LVGMKSRGSQLDFVSCVSFMVAISMIDICMEAV